MTRVGDGASRWRLREQCRAVFDNMRPTLGGGRAIAVVSPRRGDGRSSVAAGLAEAIADETGEPTILVDLDFERPSQAARVGADAEPGLLDWLMGDGDLRVLADRHNLFILPAGTPSGPAMRLVFAELRAVDLLGACRLSFSWIVLDLPPLLEYPAAALAVHSADACVVVARHRVTTSDSLARTAQLLPTDQPAGAVLLLG